MIAKFLNKSFCLSENKTTVKRELLAGLTTFLTMSYIIFINPQILHASGMNFGAVFVATCLAAALGSFLVGILANYPIAIAPSMALNVYFAYMIVRTLGFTWESALGAVFVSGLIFIFLTVTQIRRFIINAVPHSLNIGITIGIGIFIALLALKSAGLLKIDANGFMVLADIKAMPAVLFFVGFLLIVVLEHYRVTGAVIIGILAVTILSLVFGLSHFHGVFSLPPSMAPTFLQFSMVDLNHYQGISVIFIFLLVALFDSTGTFIGLLQEKQFTEDTARMQRISRGLLAESATTTMGALLGTSSTSPFIESAAGIREGGRTGLTAVTVAFLFLLALFISPLAEMIPNFAIAPALFYVGILMMRNIMGVNVTDFSEYFPCMITALMIPFTFSIADGLGLGLLSYVFIKTSVLKFKDLNATLFVLALVFLLYFCLKPVM